MSSYDLLECDEDDLPEYHEESPSFQKSIIQAQTEVAARLSRRNGADAASDLRDVFLELELEAKDASSSSQLLTTAIFAGRKLFDQQLKINRVDSAMALSLADLFLRRSEWDKIVRLPDLDTAVYLGMEVISCSIPTVPRISALMKSSSYFEERFTRLGEQGDLDSAHGRLKDAAEYARESLKDPEQLSTLLAIAACLKFKVDDKALTCIMDIPFDSISKAPLAWSRPMRKIYRFIDVRSLAAGKALRVVGLNALPHYRYTALSYVWHGSATQSLMPTQSRTLTIAGAVGADPISIDVLRTVCQERSEFRLRSSVDRWHMYYTKR